MHHFSFACRFTVVILLFANLVSGGISTTVADDDWTQFRGPGGNASAKSAQVPVTWSDSKNVLWKSPLPGRGASSPVFIGNRIFVTAYTGYGVDPDDYGKKEDLRLHLLCYEKSSGKKVWQETLVASDKAQTCTHRVIDHGYATSTPVTDGKNVYAFFAATGVVAYTVNGKKLWQTQVGIDSAGFGSASSPVLFKNLVIVNASIESKTVYAIDKQTGKIVWTIPDVKRSWSTPCLAETAGGDVELIINQIDVIRGFDPSTGKQLWTCRGVPDYTVPVPIVNDGVLYCLGGRSNRSMAIRLGGRGDVTDSHKLWDHPVGANVTSPVFAKGKIYWASDKGIANCLDAKDGSQVFKSRLPTRKRIYASIVRAGDYLLVTTRDQGIVVLKLGDQYQELAQNRFKEDASLLNAGPVVDGNNLLIRTDRFLYRIGTDSDRK